MKKYVTLCALIMLQASLFAAAFQGDSWQHGYGKQQSDLKSWASLPETSVTNFQEPRGLLPAEQKILFTYFEEQYGIERHNICAAVMQANQSGEVPGDPFQMHATINSVNKQNLKLLAAPFATLCGGALAYAARKSPQIRWISLACSAIAAYYTAQKRNQLCSLLATMNEYRKSTPLADDTLSREDATSLKQFFPQTRKFLRMSSVSMPANKLGDGARGFNSNPHSHVLYFGELYTKCYRQRLDNWVASYPKRTATIRMRYSKGIVQDVPVPITDYQPKTEYNWNEKGNISYPHILNIARLYFPLVDADYQNGRLLKFSLKDGNTKPLPLFSSDNCLGFESDGVRQTSKPFDHLDKEYQVIEIEKGSAVEQLVNLYDETISGVNEIMQLINPGRKLLGLGDYDEDEI
jgi:hypothetical protein